MKVIINHDNCQHADSYSERCLMNTIMNPEGHEPFCTVERVDDGQKALTVVLIQDGKTYTRVLHTRLEQEVAATEGWPGFAREAEVAEHSGE